MLRRILFQTRSILKPGVSLGFLLVIGVLAGLWQLQPTKVLAQPSGPTGIDATPCHLAVMRASGQVQGFHCSARLNSAVAQEYLSHQPGVTQVAKVEQYRMSLAPNDPYYHYQADYYQQIHLPEAWDRVHATSLRPVIAVLDTGVDVTNPDLKPNLWFNPWEVPGDHIDNDHNGYVDDQYGWDFVANSPDPQPKFDTGWTEVAMNHGTIVAGVAAAVGNNGQGGAGVFWSARIMPIRVLDGAGVGDTVTVAKGILYAIQNHADIINLSFVGQYSDPVLEDAINRAYRAGILVVAASGNEQQQGVNMDFQPQYPVCDDGPNGENEVIGVAAVDAHDVRADFSNYGTHCIDISAPGTRIFSTQFVDAAVQHTEFKNPYGGYWAGTSVAAPMVSGALAMLKASFPRLAPSQLRDILIAAGDELSVENPRLPLGSMGRRLDVAAAFTLASSGGFPVKSPLIIAPQSSSIALLGTYDFTGELIQQFLAYSPSFNKGVNVAAGDVDGDGQPDIITVPRAGGGPHVKIFNQRGELESQFMAFPDLFHGGLSVAAGDFTGAGKSYIVVGAGKGMTNVVRLFDGTGVIRGQFVPYDPSYTGGVNVAVGDVNGDGQLEIITAPASFARLPVRVFDAFGRKKSEFYPYPSAFRGGVNVAVGDMDGSGAADIVTAPGADGQPQVKVFTYKGKLVKDFMAYAKTFRGGVNLTAGDVDGDGVTEIVTAAGAGGGPHVRVFTLKGEVKSQFLIDPIAFRGGLTLTTLR